MVTLLMEILINFLMLMTYSKKVELNYTITDITKYEFYASFGFETIDVIKMLGIIHFIFSVLRAITYLIVNVRLIVSKNWQELIQKNNLKVKNNESLKAEFADTEFVKDVDNLSNYNRE